MNKVKFHGKDFDIKFDRYIDGNSRAIYLLDDEGVYCIASVNVPGHVMPDNHVLIKNYSENEGILDVLIEADIIRQTGQVVRTGFVTVDECEIIVKL